jgi:hypothetical protein
MREHAIVVTPWGIPVGCEQLALNDSLINIKDRLLDESRDPARGEGLSPRKERVEEQRDESVHLDHDAIYLREAVKVGMTCIRTVPQTKPEGLQLSKHHPHAVQRGADLLLGVIDE